MTGLIAPRLAGSYNIIYADPPWRFRGFGKKNNIAGEKCCIPEIGPASHYDVQDIHWIKNLPVNEWAAPDAVLLLWVTDPLLEEGLDTMHDWGFTYKTVAFTWAKQGRVNKSRWHIGMGFYTRANPEMCLLGTKGKTLRRENKGVRQLVVSPVREHSRKPDSIRNDIVRLFGDIPRLEMFARTRSDGWDVWGDEANKFSIASGLIE